MCARGFTWNVRPIVVRHLLYLVGTLAWFVHVRMCRDGATIPALASFQQLLGLHTTKFGWGLSEMIHAPNERLK